MFRSTFNGPKQRPKQIEDQRPETSDPPTDVASSADAGAADPDWEHIEAEVLEPAAEAEPDGQAEAAAEDAEAAQLRKDVFHSAVALGFKTANGLRVRAGEPALKSLVLDNYGDVGRAATDQMHDRLMELPWFSKVFGPIHLYAARYGAILAFGVAVNTATSAELAEIERARRQAANDDAPAEPAGEGAA